MALRIWLWGLRRDIKAKILSTTPVNQLKLTHCVTRPFLGVDPSIPWSGRLYQYANRIAHLYFLRELNNVPAFLVFLSFTGDSNMDGPGTEAEWKAAITLAKEILGLPKTHKLSKYIVDVFIDVSMLPEEQH